LRTIRAFISDEFRLAAGGIELQVGMQELNDQGLPVRTDAILTFQDEHGNPVDAKWRWHFIGEHERGLQPMTGASLTLEEGVGQAILEALARHYHGTSDTHRMANDLGRERQRRDQAEDRLWNILDRFSTGLSMESNADPVAMQLAQYLPALSLAIARATGPPPVGIPSMQFHSNTLCRGHMPWDLDRECPG
jgi:hypothetical protein